MKIEELANYFDWDKQLNGYSLESSIRWHSLFEVCQSMHYLKDGNLIEWLRERKINLTNFELEPDECQVINDPINHGFEEDTGILLMFNFFWEEKNVGETNVSEAYVSIDLFYSMKDDKFFHFEIDS